MSFTVRGPLGVSSLPFSLAALHFIFRDGERFTDGVVEAFGFGVAGNAWGGSDVHANSLTLMALARKPMLDNWVQIGENKAK